MKMMSMVSSVIHMQGACWYQQAAPADSRTQERAWDASVMMEARMPPVKA